MKLYLESSVFNFVFADDTPEKREITKIFFESKSFEFELFVSDVVYDELSKTKEPKRSALLGLLSKYPLTTLVADEETIGLAKEYIKEGLVPEKYLNDAVHIAIAVVNKLDAVASWNMEHIVKMKTIIGINQINSKKGYKQIMIITPEGI
ncbi:PIN domain nuclease [Candidatus Woesearchaeota archaeon]|nr:PIN domain nuclease [Candidatus Woesearchaeota archaeon]